MGQLPTSGPASAAYFLSPHWSIEGGKEGGRVGLTNCPAWAWIAARPAARPLCLAQDGRVCVHPLSLQGDASQHSTSGNTWSQPGNIIVIAGFSHLLRRSCDKETELSLFEWK